MTQASPSPIVAPSVAWPTIALASVNLALYVETTVVGFQGSVPWWVAMLFNTLWCYVGYTALHEAVHRNVDRTRPWVNTMIGMFGALPLYHNVEFHKLTHLGHHAHLNNEEKDTDHWVASSNPFDILFRCATLFLVHYKRGFELARASSTSRVRFRRFVFQNVLTILPIVLTAVFVSWPLAIALQIVPGLLAGTILAFTFDWLPHHPHESSDPRQGTRVFEATGHWNTLLTYVYLWQNYHQAHHVRPTIPFYLYKYQYERDKVLN